MRLGDIDADDLAVFCGRPMELVKHRSYKADTDVHCADILEIRSGGNSIYLYAHECEVVDGVERSDLRGTNSLGGERRALTADESSHNGADIVSSVFVSGIVLCLRKKSLRSKVLSDVCGVLLKSYSSDSFLIHVAETDAPYLYISTGSQVDSDIRNFGYRQARICQVP